MKADSHKVRMKFNHGNAMSLDLKGCGSIYIEPGYDYFFENAPMQFINYLAQLKRLGIEYRLTNDKKGCYMTIDLAGYQTNEPKTVLGKLRSNLVQTEKPIVRLNTIKDSDEDTSTDVEDLIPKGTFKEDLEEIKIEGDPIPETSNQSEADKLNLAADDLEEDSVSEPEITSDKEDDKVEEVKTEEPKILSEEEIASLSKAKLIEYAHELGLADISEIYTKKEIRAAITEALSK